MSDPYREPARKPPRRIVQIASAESGSDAGQWSVTLHALDDRGDVWRLVATTDVENYLTNGVWHRIPALPKDEEEKSHE